MFTLIVFVVNLRGLILTRHQTKVFFIITFIQVVGWIAYATCWQLILPDAILSWPSFVVGKAYTDTYGAFDQIAPSPVTWVGSFAVGSVCLLIPLVGSFISRIYFTDDVYILQEYLTLNKTTELPEFVHLRKSGDTDDDDDDDDDDNDGDVKRAIYVRDEV